MTLSSQIGTATEYRGYKLSLAKAKTDWCVFVIPPEGQPEIIMADSRDMALMMAQHWVNARLSNG